MAVQKNFDYFLYVSDNGENYALRADDDWGNAAISGGAAAGGAQAYGRATVRRAPKADGVDHLFTAEINDIHTEGNYWIWGLAAPERLDYDIAPGVSINFYWLIFTVPV